MTKQVELTEDVINKFKAKFGEEANIENFYIFECRAFSTEPVHQGTIYDGATATSTMVAEMADKVNNTDENIGIHIMHKDGDLNIGRVFSASVSYEGDGVTALYATCGILKDSDSENIVNRIENNVLDEVSVQFVPEHARCSKCGWDYMGEDATFEHWIDRTCENGHTIGDDGCHLELDGLLSFSEISIVNRGAAKNPKILSQKKRSLFSEGELMSLAASGKTPEFLVATFNSKMEKIMEDKGNVTLSAEELEGMKAELSQLKLQLDLGEKVKNLEATLSEKDAVISEKEKAVADKEAELSSEVEAHKAEVEELNVKLSAVEEEKSALLSFLQEEVKKVACAAGKKDVEVPSDLGGISAMLSENQQILATLIPAGGVAKSQTNEGLSLNSNQLKSFQVRR